MIATQFYNLLKTHNIDKHQDFVEMSHHNIRCLVKEGKFKDHIGVIQGCVDLSFNLFINEKMQKISFTKIDLIDENDEPIVMHPKDITNRDIKLGSWLCYSQSTEYSHALEIGKVNKISPRGTLTVTPEIRDGKKLTKTSWYRKDKNISSPDRTILLPVDEATLMVWILKDFTDIGNE